ncbi:MAG: ABC transporter substrate-binding protein [Hyphomicrobiales bacterium]|nr:ABC transporter substrate-binding protein [Hyphomicrobiales bacterium]
MKRPTEGSTDTPMQAGKGVFSRREITSLALLVAVQGAWSAHTAGATGASSGNSGHAVRRIITIGADLTEIVAELDGLERLVGCDRSSRRPAAVRDRANLGYFRSVSAEGIVSLDPDLIITTANIGPDGITDKLKGAGINIAFVDDEATIDGIVRKINKVASLIGHEHRAQTLIAALNHVVADLAQRFAPEQRRRPRLLFVLSADAGMALAAGDIATITAAIELAGAENAGKAWKNVKPVSREAFAANPPDGIITTPEVLARAGGAAGLLKLTGYDSMLAASAVMAIDAGPFMLFGPSTPSIAREVARHFLPELFRGEPG